MISGVLIGKEDRDLRWVEMGYFVRYGWSISVFVNVWLFMYIGVWMLYFEKNVVFESWL